MVRQLHRLRVSTLDSFFIQIAHSFSLELGLPPGWEIADESADADLRTEAISAMLQDESTEDVVRLMHLLTKGEAARSVSEQIAALVAGLYSVYIETPREAWQSLPRRRALTDSELQSALEALSAVPFPDGKRYQDTRAQDLANAAAGAWEAFLGKGLGAKIFDGTEQFYGKAIAPEILAAYRPLVEHARAVLVNRIADQTDATRQLLDHFDAAYQRLKRTHHVLRFEDITRTLGAAGLADRLEEIGFRLDGHVAHLLLDEFQDTSPPQWRVLRPLAQRIVRGGPRDSFFCVGDVKQAIYGWRGGVAEIFQALDDELPGLAPQLLNQSRRSAPAVIDCVNRVFGSIADNRALERYPAAARQWAGRFLEHTTVHATMPGYCAMVAAPLAGEGENQGDVTLEFAARQVARLYRQSPGLTFGVLVRRNVAVARLIFELHRQGIDASEEGGNPLTDSPAVQLILSLLTLADHPGDTTARFHVAHSPLAAGLGLTDHADAAAACRAARQIRRALLSDGYGATLYGFVKALAPACDRRDLNRLMQLVEIAYGYEDRATLRTDDFVTLVRRRKVEDPTSAPIRVMTVHQAKGLQFDVVVLPELDAGLTGQPPELVAGSSQPAGRLERVCRYVSKDLRPLLPEQFQRMFEIHEQRVVEESLCVLYVAMTRAVHALHMLVAPSKANERNIPTTFAGVLRSALTDGGPAAPESLLYEHGNAAWHTTAAAAKPQAIPTRGATAGLPSSAAVSASPSPSRALRGLEHRSPSQLEGGGRVDLARLLRRENAAALNRGSLMHAWFECIEWLDDAVPGDAQLRQLAAALGAEGKDLPALIGQFRAALARPVVRAALSRATYQCPAADASAAAVHAGPEVAQPRWQVWRERPFAIREGDVLLSGKIDRLVVLSDGDRPLAADVLDFKTDQVRSEEPRAIDARVETYRPQLDAYRRAVARVWDLEVARVSARLLFVEPGEIRSVGP
jgi:ATP-dependent exoDNAse (exonuclease V) beta subunit